MKTGNLFATDTKHLWKIGKYPILQLRVGWGKEDVLSVRLAVAIVIKGRFFGMFWR